VGEPALLDATAQHEAPPLDDAYSPSAGYTLVLMVTGGLLDHHGGMTLSSPHHSQRTPAHADAVHHGLLRRSQRHGRSPGASRWRDVEIGAALYSTGPLVVFLVTVLLVVGAVWLLALQPTAWMLVLAAVVHLLASALVLAVIVALLDED
jgi:hypothetical protein